MTKTDSPVRVTSAVLKIVALVTMTLDHAGHVFIIPLMYGSHPVPWLYFALRTVGRVAFPLYAFMLSEGCRHTKNIQKYLLRMAVFAAVSEIPFNLACNKTLSYPEGQNVFFTLFLGLCACYVVRLLEENGKSFLWSIPVTALLCASAFVLSTDYAWYGVLFVWLCCVTNKTKPAVRFCILAVGLLLIAKPWEIFLHPGVQGYVTNSLRQFFGSLVAVPLILAYNGQKGKLRMHKYFFYAYYPAHLLLLWLLLQLLF